MFHEILQTMLQNYEEQVEDIKEEIAQTKEMDFLYATRVGQLATLESVIRDLGILLEY